METFVAISGRYMLASDEIPSRSVIWIRTQDLRLDRGYPWFPRKNAQSILNFEISAEEIESVKK